MPSFPPQPVPPPAVLSRLPSATAPRSQPAAKQHPATSCPASLSGKPLSTPCPSPYRFPPSDTDSPELRRFAPHQDLQRDAAPSSDGNRCRPPTACPANPPSASIRPPGESPAPQPMRQPSIGLVRSCRNRPKAPPHPSAVRAPFPRSPSPSNCDRASRSVRAESHPEKGLEKPSATRRPPALRA